MKTNQLKRSFFLLIGLFSLTLTGCNEKIYSTDWTSDSEGHWHTCLSHDDDGEKKDYSTHTYGDWIIVTEASETSLGKKKQVCKVCKYTHFEDIAKLEHTHKFSTEWSSNETQHWHDSTCGHDVKSNEENHTFGEWEVVIPATEEAVGSQKKICSVCNFELVEEVAKLPHTHNLVKVEGLEPTCALSGYMEHYHCDKCGKDYKDDKGFVLLKDIFLPATGQHNMVDGVCTTCGETISSITYSSVYDTENKVMGYKVSGIVEKDFLNIVVPKFYNNLPVIGIEDNAFKDCSKATRIELPKSIISIGASAFENCKALESFNIPDGINTINKNTFNHCESLKSVEIPSSVVNIDNAFNYCTSLNNIVIPKNVELIGESVFLSTNLASISVEEGNKIYDSRNNCNAVINSTTNELIIGTSSTIIPSDVTSIASYAFSGCSSLSSIVLNDGLLSIGLRAFSNCTSLTSFTLPKSVTSLKSSILYGCENIVTLNVDENNSIYSSLDNNNVIVELSTFTLVQGISTSNIDNPYIKIIGDYAFAGFKNIQTFTCSLYINSIGKFAFGGCSGLKTATFGLALTTIEMYAFYSCSLLSSIDLPSTVTKIGSNAFGGCAILSYVLLRSTFTDLAQLGSNIFNACTLLKSIYYRGETPNAEFNALFPNITIIYYSKTEPINEGYYWYFNLDKEPTVWPS